MLNVVSLGYSGVRRRLGETFMMGGWKVSCLLPSSALTISELSLLHAATLLRRESSFPMLYYYSPEAKIQIS